MPGPDRLARVSDDPTRPAPYPPRERWADRTEDERAAKWHDRVRRLAWLWVFVGAFAVIPLGEAAGNAAWFVVPCVIVGGLAALRLARTRPGTAFLGSAAAGIVLNVVVSLVTGRTAYLVTRVVLLVLLTAVIAVFVWLDQRKQSRRLRFRRDERAPR